MAVKKGAKGLLYYPDPKIYAPEGLGKNSTYPNAPWLSSEAVALAGVYGRFGDPETPYLPSIDGIRRTVFNDIKNDLPMLIQPISYGTARTLLQQVDGKTNQNLTWVRCAKPAARVLIRKSTRVDISNY